MLNLTPLDVLILALATGYLSYVVVDTHGAFGMFAWIRKRLPLGGLTTCPHCLAPYFAVLCFVLYHTPLQPVVWIVAAGGLGLMLVAYSGVRHL